MSLPQLFWPNRLPTMHTRRSRRHHRIDATRAPGMCAGLLIGACREPQFELAFSLHPPSALCALYIQCRSVDIRLFNARIACTWLARSQGRSGATPALDARDMGAPVRGFSRNDRTAGLPSRNDTCVPPFRKAAHASRFPQPRHAQCQHAA